MGTTTEVEGEFIKRKLGGFGILMDGRGGYDVRWEPNPVVIRNFRDYKDAADFLMLLNDREGL